MRNKIPPFDYWAFESVHLFGGQLLLPFFFTLWLLCAGAGLLKPPKRIRKWPYFAPGDY